MTASRIAATQLAAALEPYRRHVERNGGAVAPLLAELESMARSCVMSGQGGHTFGDLDGSPDAAPVTPRLLTYRDAATVLALSESGVKRLVRNGDLPVVHVGGAARIRLSDIDVYVERLGPRAEEFRHVS